MNNVLVVDPVAICREPIAEALRHNGYRVSSATDGNEAIGTIARETPDVILLDLALPNLDGFGVLRALRRNPDWQTIPVMVLTNSATRSNVIEARRLGVQSFTLKSNFSLPELFSRINDVLSHRPNAVAAGTSDPGPDPSSEAAAVAAAGAPPDSPPKKSAARCAAPVLTRELTLKRIEEVSRLKTLAGAVAEVMAIASSSTAGRSDLAGALSRDPVLATRVLQMANSSAYRRTVSHIQDIQQAIGTIGFGTVRNIAATVSVFDSFPADAADGLGALRCWQHSLAVAIVMDRIQRQPGTPSYMIGLCHDLGEVVLRQYFAPEYQSALELAAGSTDTLDEIEQRVFGLSHRELTGILLERMGLPAEITGSIREFFAAGDGRKPGTPMAVRLRQANEYAHGLLFASSPNAAVSPARVHLTPGDANRTGPIDADGLRTEVVAATHLLARLSPTDAAKLAEPLFPKQKVRIGYVREEAGMEFDPLATALHQLAEVIPLARLPQSAEDCKDSRGLVILRPAPVSGEVGAEELRGIRDRVDKRLSILYLVQRGVEVSADCLDGLTLRTYAVPLAALAEFIGGLV